MKVKFTLGIGYGSSRDEVMELDIEDLVDDPENYDQDELDQALTDYWDSWVWNYIDGGAEVIEE